MRIFDPKDQLGNAILSSADTQKSSVKLEKQMTVGGGAITLTSTDISDIENWELSNASVEVDGQMISFLPDTSRDGDGNLVITLGETFSDVVLILKRTVFDGMKQEEEITIAVEIRQLMEKTMAAATATTPRTQKQIQENIAEWKALGTKATTVEPTNYPYANCTSTTELTKAGFNTGETSIGSDVCLISLETVNNSYSGTRTFPNVQNFEADLPSLKNGSYMFNAQKNLETFTGKIPNITNASYMFYDSSKLTSWTVELPNSLTNAVGMFWGCTGLTSWNGTLPNSLADVSKMFNGCKGLTSWTAALPDSITTASSMFSGCSKLTEWTVALPNSLKTAFGMFQSCTGLTSWSIALPNSITDAQQMFSGCSKLTEWTVALPNSLTDARSMFSGCSSLTSWNVELPDSITRASSMFNDCSGLTSFSTPSGSLPNGFTDASNMFKGCTELTEWTVALPNVLTNASAMFSGCKGLTEWKVALPNTITQAGGSIDGIGMFSGCSNLESFTVAMPTSLKKNARYMFYGCKLDLASVKNISESIQTCTGISTTDKTFTLGIVSSLEGNTEVQGYLEDIRNKGWTVEVSYNA